MLKEGVAFHKIKDVPLLERFIHYISNRWPNLLGKRVLVAVSGGPDSTALLYLLHAASHRLSLQLAVAHFDHHLRGNESKRDAEFVKELSQRLELPFYLGQGDVKAHALNNKLTLQEAARGLRYDFLSSTASQIGADFIATAHTANDQAEEILIRLIRGSSLSGLSGIPSQRQAIIRPLLPFKKEELLDFLKSKEIPFVKDSSNEKDCYLRNRIRKELLPLIEKKFNPSAINTLCRTADLLQDENRFLNQLAGRLLKKSLIEANLPEMALLDAQVLSKADPVLRRRVFMLLMNHWPMTKKEILQEHLERIDALFKKGQKISAEIILPKGLVVRSSYGKLIIAKSSYWQKLSETEYELLVDAPGTYQLPHGLGEIKISLSTPTNIASSKTLPKVLWVSCKKLSFPVLIRNKRAGDIFWPVNRSCPRRLKKFLINQRINKFGRNLFPILMAKDKIVTLCGIEIGELFKVDKDEKEAYQIEWLNYPKWLFG